MPPTWFQRQATRFAPFRKYEAINIVKRLRCYFCKYTKQFTAFVPYSTVNIFAVLIVVYKWMSTPRSSSYSRLFIHMAIGYKTRNTCSILTIWKNKSGIITWKYRDKRSWGLRQYKLACLILMILPWFQWHIKAFKLDW